VENSVAGAATLLSSTEVCARAGCSYRQLDYWVRHGAVTPTVAATGSGTQRGFTEADVVAVRAAARLAVLGAPVAVLAAGARAAALPGAPERLVVTSEGAVFGADEFAAHLHADDGVAWSLAAGAWVIDLSEPLDDVALVG